MSLSTIPAGLLIRTSEGHVDVHAKDQSLSNNLHRFSNNATALYNDGRYIYIGDAVGNVSVYSATTHRSVPPLAGCGWLWFVSVG